MGIINHVLHSFPGGRARPPPGKLMKHTVTISFPEGEQALLPDPLPDRTTHVN